MAIDLNVDWKGIVNKATYQNKDLKIIIEVKVFVLRSENCEDNIGNVLEKYRDFLDNNDEVKANRLFSEKKAILNKFISGIFMPFNEFHPDYITTFLPLDKNRNDLLKNFATKLTSPFPDKEKIDFSKNFTKKNRNSSIKNGLSEKDFTFTPLSDQKLIKNLLLIDDVINQGRTVEIFLNKLVDKSLINNDTTVKLICMYNIGTPDKEEKEVIKNLFK